MTGPGPNLARRTASACVLVPGVLALTWAGGWALFALVAAIVGRSSWEFYHLAANAGYRPLKSLGILLCLGLCAQIHLAGTGHLPLAMVLATAVVLAAALRGGTDGFAARAAVTLAGVLYTGLLGSVPLLMAADRELLRGDEPGVLLGLIFVSLWITDTAAYGAGLLWGRRKLVPGISPNKTVTGAAAGLLAGLLPALLQPFAPGFSHWELAGLFLVVAASAQTGDLVQSALKRDFGVKDAPALIPGHGGFLDRFDSYFFCFPLAWAYLLLLQQLSSPGSG
ncbi:MAG: phosphatidate cytidylyltransferase [Gemmatimonadetes bacterium]|nr:phosphatidate cytidylyltransferase [Gemmatimonadota bacterium]